MQERETVCVILSGSEWEGGERQAELKMRMRGLNSDIKKRLRKERKRKRGNVDVRGRSPVDCHSVNQAVRGLGQEDKKE